MSQILGYTLMLLIGGAMYCCIEIAYRGFTHVSMFFTGGACFLLVGVVEYILGDSASIVGKMLLCALLVTVVEFFVGMLVNRALHMNVWDYSGEQYNLQGQICLFNANMWFLLSAPMIFLYDYLRYLLMGVAVPHYKLF